MSSMLCQLCRGGSSGIQGICLGLSEGEGAITCWTQVSLLPVGGMS